MAHVEKVIRLSDGSTHYSKQSAERHLTNVICSGGNNEIIESMALIKNTTGIRDFLFENESKVDLVLKLIRELKEIEDINL